MRPYIDEVRKIHDHFGLREPGAEDIYYRLTLCMEELGEIAACVSKGKSRDELAEEHADLMILLLGNCIALDLDIETAFWKKCQKVLTRPVRRLADGKVRVTEYRPGPDAAAPPDAGGP
jgi:NTP pyrophosphatase (non-canonical NTP hydrolase)